MVLQVEAVLHVQYMGLRHAHDIRSQAPLLFSHVCVEKIGEPGNEATNYVAYK